MNPEHNLNRRAIGMAAITLLIAALSCARADVPGPSGAGWPESTDLAADTATPSTEEGVATATAVPTFVTPKPLITPTFPATPTMAATGMAESILYAAQPGDTLHAVAVRFGVIPSDISTTEGTLGDEKTLLDPRQQLIIPRRLGIIGPSDKLIPDSELVYSPHAADFDPSDFMETQNGYLKNYREYVGKKWRTGPEVVAMAAQDNSINPRILITLLEYHSGWVTNPDRPTGIAFDYPLGQVDSQHRGLYRQLTWLANELGKGYYGWRAGTVVDLRLADNFFVRIDPELNAGTVALQYYLSTFLGDEEWTEAVSPEGMLAIYTDLFSDPWSYLHPLYEPGIEQPPMILPFLPGRVWALTGGPHGAWEREAAWAALDFAPSSTMSGCVVSDDWVVAVAPGLIVRSENGVVILDLDGDGREETGWVLLYLHIAHNDRIEAGAFVEQGDLIGHPSCEGGISTGTHVHIARKYNGEWILADGPLPFEMSGWVAHAGSEAYDGALTKGDQEVLACSCASQETLIWR